MSPSSSSRWLKCPGSLHVEAPESEGKKAARIGTLGHYLVERELCPETPIDSDLEDLYDSLSESQVEDLEDKVAFCVEFIDSVDSDVKLYETKIQSDLIEEHGGTVDVIAYNSRTHALHVIDFKFGRVKVDSEDNTQIQCYINLARQLFPDAVEFYGTIVQPLAGEPHTATFSAETLDAHMAAVLEASISKEFHAGDHCKWCPALSMCETAAAYLRDELREFPDLKQVVAEVESKPTEEDVAKIAKLYKLFKIAEAASDGASGILKKWAKEGADISVHGLNLRFSNRTEWAPGAETEFIRLELYPAVYSKTSLVTPKQLQEALDLTKELFEEKFEKVIQKRQIESLVIGKGEPRTFDEFDEIG